MDLHPSKKARFNDPSPPHPPLGKRMQRDEKLSPQKQIMHMYAPRLEPLRMVTRRADIGKLLRDLGYLTTGRRPTDLELKDAYDRYIRLYPTDYDITLYDFYNIAIISNGGKIRRHKKHVDSYKKRGSIHKKRFINKKRDKSMKKKRS